MNEIKISVIVPVYNVEKYIRKCIESIINQTFKDIEIIIVNDGTKDNSIKIAEEYLSDKRIKIVNKENGGVSSARNYGLEAAKGEYIFFMDADDYIEENMLEILYKDSNSNDIVICNNYDHYEESKTYKIRKKNNCIKGVEEQGIYFWGYVGLEIWNKLYKREFLLENNILYSEKIIHSDVFFNIKTLFLAHKVKYIDKPLYHYISSRPGSITKQKTLEKTINAFKVIIDNIEKLEKIIPKDNFYKIRLFLCKMYYKGYILELENKYFSNENIEEIDSFLRKNYTDSLSSKEKLRIKKDMEKIVDFKFKNRSIFLNLFYLRNGLLNLKIVRRLLKTSKRV